MASEFEDIIARVKYGKPLKDLNYKQRFIVEDNTPKIINMAKDAGIVKKQKKLNGVVDEIVKTKKIFKNRTELLNEVKKVPGFESTNIKSLTPSKINVLKKINYTDTSKLTEEELKNRLGKEKLDKFRKEGLSERVIKNRSVDKKYFANLSKEQKAKKTEDTRQRNKNLSQNQILDRKEKALVRRQSQKGFNFYKVNKAENLLWNDLLRTAKNKKGYFTFKGESPVSGKYYNKEATEKFTLIDKKGNEFKYSTLSEDIKKHSGEKLDDVLRPYKQKEFLAKEGLTKELNKLSGYQPGTNKSVFHTQHIQGIDKNPFKVHLTFGEQNLSEAGSKKSFDADWRAANKKPLGKGARFKAQKEAVNRYYKSLGPDIVSQIGRKPKGEIKTLINLLDKTGINLKPDVKTRAISLGSFPAQLAELKIPNAGPLTRRGIRSVAALGAQSGIKALGVAALPIEAYFMNEARKEGKSFAEIAAIPFLLEGKVAEYQDMMNMSPVERQAVNRENIEQDESLLDTDFYTPRLEGVEAINISGVRDRVATKRKFEEAQRRAKIANKQKTRFTLPNSTGIVDDEV